MSLSKEQIREYVRNPSRCPYCSSDDICSGPLDADGETATAEVECNQCLNVWTDIWQLVGLWGSHDLEAYEEELQKQTGFVGASPKEAS